MEVDYFYYCYYFYGNWKYTARNELKFKLK